MAAMKNDAIFTPSGRSITLATSVYTSTTSTAAKKAVATRWPRRWAESVTATAAERISTRTPVAYAPPCAITLASKARVIANATTVKTSTSGSGRH
ncbi:hypothetical protein [Planotetraspora sp. GP83]|uniref:hypothetical protein n=1 Tax=Planotetraspora sp. GP83 TaxID=3156264 RepID=UPI00351425D9